MVALLAQILPQVLPVAPAWSIGDIAAAVSLVALVGGAIWQASAANTTLKHLASQFKRYEARLDHHNRRLTRLEKVVDGVDPQPDEKHYSADKGGDE